MRRYCLFAIAVCVVSACGPSAENSDAYVFTADSSGRFPVLRSTGEAPTWTSTLVTTVGSADDSVSELGRVRSVLLDKTGGIFVVDAGYTRLVKFDASGVFVAQWGRKGSGPGEYLSPYSIAWLHDSLVILDPANSRMGMYNAQGQWVRSWPSPRITGSQQVRLYRMPPDAFWAYAIRQHGNQREGVFVRYTSAGPSDTLAFVRPAPDMVENAVCEAPDKSLHFFQAPFSANLHVLPSPSGQRAIALSAQYRVAFLNAVGDTTHMLERAAQPLPVSDAEWEEGLQEMKTFREKWPSATCDRTSFTRTKTKPVIENMFYDDVGQLWVEAHTMGGRAYDVYAVSGRLLGTVTGLPATDGIEPSVVAGRVAFVVPDSGGFNTIQIFQIGTIKK